MSLIRIDRVSPEQWQFEINWPLELILRIRLKLTDPDGDIDEREEVWDSPVDESLMIVLQTMVGRIEQLPHWRARRYGGQLRIFPASDDYVGEVTFKIERKP